MADVLRTAAGVLALLLAAAGCTGAPNPDPGSGREDVPAVGEPSTVLDVGAPRAVHRATALDDGSVLLTGGCSTAGCSGTDVAARAVVVGVGEGVRAVGTMQQPRLSHTATLLADGRVLVAGGYPGEGAPPTASLELYDPATAAFSAAGELLDARADHTATLLPDGRVLVTGGRGIDGNALRTVEIVDPATGRSVRAAPLAAPRTGHTATDTGPCVLLVGGTGTRDVATTSTTIWCAATEQWAPGPDLDRARVKHAAVQLSGGRVWVVGGAPTTESRTRFRDTELLSLGTGRSAPGPALPEGRYKIADAVATLADGRVVVAGGPSLVVLDPRARTLRAVPASAGALGPATLFSTATEIAGGRVLIVGGYDETITPSDAAAVVAVPAFLP